MKKEKRDKYKELWSSVVPDNHKVAMINSAIKKILLHREKYRNVANEYKMPWEIIGVIHMRESMFDFTRHLANGDPLVADTVRVPKALMSPLEPPYSWEEAALAAITKHAANWKINVFLYDWDIPGTLWYINSYHGFGCDKAGINDPYLWNFSNHYERGGFDSDGNFNALMEDKNPGSATVLKMMNY